MSSHSSAALILALAATLLGAGCSQLPSVKSTAKKLNSAASTEVLGYNGSLAPKTRSFSSYGELPDTVKRALNDYITTGEWVQFNYAYPQTFIRIQEPAAGKNSYWAVCIDTKGNLTGILPTKDARFLPTVGNYKMIVNKTPRNAGLSYAILKGLQGSDSMRKSIRKSAGLETPAPMVPVKVVVPPVAPKPLTPVAQPAPASSPAPAAETPAPAAEDDPFGGSTTTETETTTTETEAPAGETETTTTEEVSF